MKKLFVFLVLLLILGAQASADRGLKLKQMHEEQRIALVIGNSAYKNLSPLKNPINDAKAIKASLIERGFEVIYAEDASNAQIRKLLKEFTKKIAKGGIGLYYFAGHGINVEGRNYLIGIDALMDDKDEVAFQNIGLDYVTTKMKGAKNRLNIVILDACRNDPFSRGANGGLAPISNAKGIFVAYATEAGAVASDGREGENGIFTKYLIEHMKEPGSDIAKVFKHIRASVLKETKGKQSPGVYDQTVGDFYFTLPDTSKDGFSENKNGPFSLTIQATPKDAKIEIIGSDYTYQDGVKLPAGKYKIKVTKAGYSTKKGTVTLQNDLSIKIALTQPAQGQGFSSESEQTASSAQTNPFMKRFDKNGDNKLEKSEFPKVFLSKFQSSDTDGDGYVDASEISVMMEKNRPVKDEHAVREVYEETESYDDELDAKPLPRVRKNIERSGEERLAARSAQEEERLPPPPPPMRRADHRLPPPPPRR